MPELFFVENAIFVISENNADNDKEAAERCALVYRVKGIRILFLNNIDVMRQYKEVMETLAMNEYVELIDV